MSNYKSVYINCTMKQEEMFIFVAVDNKIVVKTNESNGF